MVWPGAGIVLEERAYVMLIAVSVSRAGLWAYDLAHTQVMQERVEEGRRGVINGCQTGCSQLFLVALAGLGMLFSDPQQFEILTCISVGSVLTAAVGWSLWVVCSRGSRPTDEPKLYITYM